MRFPAGWGAASAAAAAPTRAAPAATRQAPVQVASASIFSPYLTYPMQGSPADDAAAVSQPRALAYSDPTAETTSTVARRPSTGYQLASATPAPERRAAEPHRTANPRGAVFNDAQIASVKQRLNLTPSQERMWPPVEAALRELAYKKPAAGAARPTLDPNSPEVARLKSAAIPLVMSFSFEQQRELRTLAHLIGLGSMVAQF